MTHKAYNRYKWVDTLKKFGCLPSIISICFVVSCVFNFSDTIQKITIGDPTTIVWVYIATIIIIVEVLICVFNYILNKYRDELNNRENELMETKRKCREEISATVDKYNIIFDSYKSKYIEFDNLLKTKSPFSLLARMVADYKTCIFQKDEEYLRYKPHPAKSAADHVKLINSRLRRTIDEYHQMQYKYEFLLSVFPELKCYVDDEIALLQLQELSTMSEVNENYDRVLDWIDINSYKTMSIDERNQLALDRYKKRKKTNWELGIEYELYIGYLLREGKYPFIGYFHVTQFGEINGLKDLGRDIIAEKYEKNGSLTIYIIQCKRWSEKKTVHENSICQLYGTTIEYRISHHYPPSTNIVPVFVSTTELSEMAKEFAKTLGVVTYIIPMGEYPMIKCNINGNEKIYHLPFDQQYNRTVIKNEGEFYAMTVSEATGKGFRRAMKHFIN